MRALWIGIGVSLAVFALPAASWAQDKPDEGVPPQAEVVSVTKTSLTLHVPKWKPAKQRESKGLEVRYSWEGEDPKPEELRGATVRDGGVYWVVTFPDRPEIGKAVYLEYVYRFEITDAAKKTMREAAQKVIETAIDAVVAALIAGDVAAQAAADAPAKDAARTSAFAKKLAEGQGQLTAQLALLDGFTASDGTQAAAVIMAQLGFKQAGGSWTRESDALGPLSTLEGIAKAAAAATLGLDQLTSQIAVDVTTASAPCPDAIKAVKNDDGVEIALKAVEACADAYALAFKDDAAGARALRTTAATFASHTYDTLDALDGDALVFRQGLGQLTKADAKDPATNRVLFAMQALIAAKTKAVRDQTIAEITDTIVEQRLTLASSSSAESILKLEADRSKFEAVTGFVYIVELDDIVMPSMLAICPWGCLKVEDGTADYGFTKHTLSFDLGVKAATIDRFVDKRHDGQLGMMVGMSWNPIDVVRLSSGLYLFENAQTERLNLTGYGGITINVLHAGELLGVFGVSEAPKASITPKQSKNEAP